MDRTEDIFRRQSKRSYNTMSNSHRNDDSSSLFIPEHDDHYDNGHSSRRLALPQQIPSRPTLPLPPGMPRTRFEGDGLDYRTPVFGSRGGSSAVTIDLTAEDGGEDISARDTSAGSSRAQRHPRFGRNLISEDEGSRAPSRSHAAPNPRPQFAALRRPARFNLNNRQPSPQTDMDDEQDIEFVSERAISPGSQPLSRHLTPAIPAQRTATPYAAAPNREPVDLTTDDEVVLLRSRAIQPEGGVNAERPHAGQGTRSVDNHNDDPGVAGGYGGFGIGGHVMNILRGEGANLNGRLMQRLEAFANLDEPLWGGHHGHRPPPGMPGAFMDYGGVGFDMGYVGGNRPPSPKYSPPPEPEAGFTRNPGEEDVVVCPNCGDELAVSEEEVKQQVWVVKGCGHAYCGECAQNRKRGKGKGKARAVDLPPSFKTCVVDGCGKSTAGKHHMFQVYLGT